MSRRLSLFGLILVLPITLQAQSARVLLPVIAKNVGGAFGSSWTTDFVIFNDSASDVAFNLPHQCDVGCSPGAFAIAGQPVALEVIVPPGIPTAVAQFPSAARNVIEFGLRVRDVSRQQDSWGTAVPVVWEDQAFTRPFDLLDIPLPARFRQTLRVYDLTPTDASVVRVQFYAMTNGALLKEFLLPLVIALPGNQFVPGYSQMDVPGTAPELAGVDRQRVRISPTNSSQRLWAMVSVTNNVTQELTIISPQ